MLIIFKVLELIFYYYVIYINVMFFYSNNSKKDECKMRFLIKNFLNSIYLEIEIWLVGWIV